MYERVGQLRLALALLSIGCTLGSACSDESPPAPSDAGSGGLGGRPAAGSGGSGGPAPEDGGGGSGPMSDRSTFYVEAGQLFDRCGERVILRGVNHPTLYVDRAGEALPEIARTRANAVRLFWFATHGVPISEAEPAIVRATQLGMIPILELHDSTCDWELDQIVDYWTSPEAVALIARHEASLIVNVANEPSAPSSSEFRSTYALVIDELRRSGIRVPLMIDGSRCGRDADVLLSEGPALLQGDPEHNLIFSVHLWDPMPRSDYASLFEMAREIELPFVVGEFGNREPPGCGAEIDYAGLISEANQHGIGWLAWSWGDDDPNTAWNTDCHEFDMTETFEFESLEGWGEEVAVDLPHSISNTSERPRSLTHGSCD